VAMPSESKNFDFEIKSDADTDVSGKGDKNRLLRQPLFFIGNKKSNFFCGKNAISKIYP